MGQACGAQGAHQAGAAATSAARTASITQDQFRCKAQRARRSPAVRAGVQLVGNVRKGRAGLADEVGGARGDTVLDSAAPLLDALLQGAQQGSRSAGQRMSATLSSCVRNLAALAGAARCSLENCRGPREEKKEKGKKKEEGPS